jgi:hypothetical protein
MDGPFLDVSDGYGAGAQHGAFSDGDAWTDERLGSDPGVGGNRDRLREQLEVNILDIV